MHTGDRLDDVNWQIDGNSFLIPSSICDHDYLEQAFENDQAFFLKTIGGQNSSEIKNRLVDNPRSLLIDSDFYKMVNETSERWFQTGLSQLSLNQKTRLIPYIRRTMRTTIPQLARTFGLNRDYVSAILNRR